MILRHPVGIAEHEGALAFDSQQAHLLLTSEATFSIHLSISLHFLLFLLRNIYFHFLEFFLLFRDLLELFRGLLDTNFHHGLFLPFSGLRRGVLKAGGTEPVCVL